MSDPCESIRLIQQNSDDTGEFIPLNQHDSDDPRESIRLNLLESIRLDQYYSELGYSRKKKWCNDIIFTTSAVGLIELGNVVYNKLCKIGPEFAECVSSSMFMYYVAQLHYMRLCRLQWQVCNDCPVANNFIIKMILSNAWIVPQLLADYFKSIGSFRDSAGIPAQHSEIMFPCPDEIDGLNGFFGRVDRNTHFHYENRISPGVAAKRIVEDLNFTLHPSGRFEKGYWNLPDTLIPAEKNAGKPTGNLLGWSPATLLTHKQVSVLTDCGVSSNKARLNELSGSMKCEECLSTVPEGSIAQHDFQVVDTHNTLPRTSVYGDISTRNSGFTPLNMHQELFAHVFRFRIWRRKMIQAGEIVNPWCCYDFNTYREVPESWCSTSNSYFLFGGKKTWDMEYYRTPPADLRLLLNRLVVKTLIQ